MTQRGINQTINEELAAYFFESLKNHSKKNPTTIENIERDIKYFLNYLYEHGDIEISSKSITEYLMFLEDKYPESSYIVKASSIRQFINWLNLENNPFWDLKLNISYNDFQYYKKEEIFSQFVEAFDYEQLLVKMIYELYLSVNELVKLNLENYNKARGLINLRGIEIILSKELNNQLKEYLKLYRDELLQGSPGLALQDPLFITRNIQEAKTRITESEISEILQKYSLRNALIKRTRIIDLLNEGKQLSEIEMLLGIKLSSFYQPFVKEKEYRLLSAYRQYHPRAKC